MQLIHRLHDYLTHTEIENSNTNVHHLGQGQDLCNRVQGNDSCLLVLTVCTEPWINDLFVVLFKGQPRKRSRSIQTATSQFRATKRGQDANRQGKACRGI